MQHFALFIATPKFISGGTKIQQIGFNIRCQKKDVKALKQVIVMFWGRTY
jgi:hypothetical protein